MINKTAQYDTATDQQDAFLKGIHTTDEAFEVNWNSEEHEMKKSILDNTQSIYVVTRTDENIATGKTDRDHATDELNKYHSMEAVDESLIETKEKDKRQTADERIIKKVLMGDKDAFSELVVQYQRLVYHVANYYLKNSDDVDDASQEVFLRSYKSLSRYNPEFKFSTWLSSITKNYCLDVLRKKNKVTLVDIDDCTFLAAENDTPEEVWLQREEREELKSAVADLPDAYQEVVNLYHEKELSYLDIADRMSKPLSIVKNRLMRARRMLQKNLVVNELHG